MHICTDLMEFIKIKLIMRIIVVICTTGFMWLLFTHPLLLLITKIYYKLNQNQFNQNLIPIHIHIQYLQYPIMNEEQYDEYFLSAFEQKGKKTKQQYGSIVEQYDRNIIPFEIKRMKQNQSISFKNTSLEREKFQLLKKIQELSSENHRQDYILANQKQKIKGLEYQVEDLDRKNHDNLNIIQALKISSRQLEASLDQKILITKQVQSDKKQVLKDYNARKADYDSLLVNFKREKNAIAEKLEYMNQLEDSLKEKQRKIEQHQFYLKKEWEKFEEAKKEMKKQMEPAPVMQRRTSLRSQIKQEQQPEPINQKNKYQRLQILKNPVKKLFKHHNSQIYDITFNYNGNLIATCGGDRSIKMYDVLNYKSGITIQGHSADSIYLSLSLDYSGDKLLAGSTDRSVQVFSTSTGKQLHSFVGHGYRVNSVSWSSAKEKCISGSQDKQIKIWQIEKASNILSIPCGKPVKYISCNTNQPVIYSGHSDGSVRLYSLNQNSTPIAQIKVPGQYPINSISVLSNRSHILISTQQGSPIYIIDLKMNKQIHRYSGKQFSNTLVRAQLSPSEKYIVAGNSDGSIYYWNKDKENLQKKIVDGHEKSITTMKYHFLSSVLTTCDKEGNVTIWQ